MKNITKYKICGASDINRKILVAKNYLKILKQTESVSCFNEYCMLQILDNFFLFGRTFVFKLFAYICSFKQRL